MFHTYRKSKMNDDVIDLCASIGHYAEKPLSITSAITTEENGRALLLFDCATEYDFEGKDKFILITDSTISEEFDMLFKPNEFHEALEAYHELKVRDQIDLGEELMRFDISQNIQPNGVTDNGKLQYDIDGLSNGNIAILATCLYFIRYIKNVGVLEACTKFAENSKSLYEPGTILSF